VDKYILNDSIPVDNLECKWKKSENKTHPPKKLINAQKH
jgi:hypothetical protein